MTQAEAIKTGKKNITTILVYGGRFTVCGACRADRKACSSNMNENCVAQYLMSRVDEDFVCEYVDKDTPDQAEYRKPIIRLQQHWAKE